MAQPPLPSKIGLYAYDDYAAMARTGPNGKQWCMNPWSPTPSNEDESRQGKAIQFKHL